MTTLQVVLPIQPPAPFLGVTQPPPPSPLSPHRKSLQQTSDGEDSLDASGASDEDSDAPEQEDEEEPASDEDEDIEEDEDGDEDQLEAFKAKLNGVEAGTNGLR